MQIPTPQESSKSEQSEFDIHSGCEMLPSTDWAKTPEAYIIIAEKIIKCFIISI